MTLWPTTLRIGDEELKAQQAGKASVEEYFKTVFASEVEGLFKVLSFL